MAKKSMAKKSMKKRAMKKSAKSYKTVAGANRAVFYGKISKTKGSLMKSKSGKIVSSKKSALGKKNKWIAACNAARKALKIKGFSPIKKGTALYKKVKSLYK